ncbi:MAG: hypothetical protein M1813_000855 [Trichoglossum hirsutum]|nr:MAG: hypothetical protein M1813_000855 [Trichoglossum hirsutum]
MSPAPPTDNSSSSHTLPTEILGNILSFLAPELPDVAGRPLTANPPKEFLRSRSTLFHMCLMSSRLEALARPLLFKTIVVWEADSLLLLWRTLRCRPDLSRFVHQMAFWITLTRQSVVKSVTKAAKERLESSDLPQDQNLYRTLVDCHGIHGSVEHDMPQFIVFDVLCRTPHLTMLSLQVPKTLEDIPYVYLMRMIARSHDLNVAPARPVTSYDQSPGVSRFLNSLQLCLDPCPLAVQENRSYRGEDMGFDHQDFWPLFGISSLVRLHCWGDDACRGLGFLLGGGRARAPPGNYLGRIQELCLDASSSGPKPLYTLCKNAPQLQTLRVSPRRHSQGNDFWGQVYTDNLNQGLLMRAATLRHLHLDFYDLWEYHGYVRPYQMLTCLPRLCHLETLQVQLQTLFGRRSAITSNDIGNMFPNSLVELTLDDIWDQDVIESKDPFRTFTGLIGPEDFRGGWRLAPGVTEAEFWHTYGKGIKKMMVRLCEVSAERLPHLRRFHYVSDYWSRRYNPQENPFDDLQEMFSERSIEFYAGKKTHIHA